MPTLPANVAEELVIVSLGTLFVFKVKSPVPWVVIVALALLSPTWTVSAPRFTSPVPFGIISISLFEVVIIS